MKTRSASLVAAMGLAVAITLAPAAQQSAQAQSVSSTIVITGLELDDLAIVDGVLTATSGTVTGLLGGLPFTTDVENFALELLPEGSAAGCSVLDLELGPINVALLGLFIDTTPICLEITAIPGGGLLGDLLCGLAGGIGVLDLGTLEQLLGLQLPGLLSQVLNTGLATSEQDEPQEGDEDICTGECEVLFLSLGPVDLTLLGLNVMLDDCSDEEGPVQVCVSATRGEGLLGNLLCAVSDAGLNLSLDNVLALLRRALNGTLPSGLGNRPTRGNVPVIPPGLLN